MAIDQAVKVDADKTLMDVFREGLFTRALGYPRSRNPYLAGRLNFKFWRSGWEWIDNENVELPLRDSDSE
jgi:hypothetical protein